jgi:hypothetical protein
MLLAVYADGWFRIAAFCIAALPVLTFVAIYVFFALKDPDKLQSESYQLQKRTLELIEDKSGPIAVMPASLELITNPAGPTNLLDQGGKR